MEAVELKGAVAACTVEGKALAAAVARLKRTIKAGGPPVTRCALVRLQGASLEIVTTSVGTFAGADLPADLAVGDACVLVDAGALLDAAKAAGKARVSLVLEDGRTLALSAGPVTRTLPSVDPDAFPDYPAPPDGAVATLPARDLSALLDRVAYAMGKDERRPHLCGALLETDADVGTLRVVATDGHRLTAAQAGANVTATEPFVVSRAGVEALARLVSGRAVASQYVVARREADADGCGWAWFECGDGWVCSRLYGEKFPAYRQVIPGDQDIKATAHVDRASLLVAAEAVGAKGRGLVISAVSHMDGGASLRLTRDDPDEGSAEGEVGAVLSGATVRVGVQTDYLTDVLKGFTSDRVDLGFGGELDPITIRDDAGSVAVVMPRRL
jgi:DNA polymerase-3 subunit beta